jgi:chromosome segregation ATPase
MAFDMEEFIALQAELMGLSEEVHELKDNLKAYERNEPSVQSDILRTEAEIQTLLSAREEARVRHKTSAQALVSEAARLRRENEEQAKRMAERSAELSQKVGDLTQKVKDQEETIDKLRVRIRGHDARRAKKAEKLDLLTERELILRPRIEFLRVSRSFPMYFEDRNGHIAVLRRKKAVVEEELKAIAPQVEETRKAHRELRLQIQAKADDLKLAQGQLQSAKERLQQSGKEIAHTQKALSDAASRLELAKEQRERLHREREELQQQIIDNRRRFENDMAEIERCKAEFEANMAALRSSSVSEVSAYDERIQKLRHTLTYIKETDADPDMPRVDVDLRKQIERVKSYQQDLVKQAQRCDQETKRLNVQIQQKTWDLQTLTMKMHPTPAVLALPEFQTTFLLLKELVLQNMELKVAMAEMSEKIQALKRENNEIRRQLCGIGG